MGSSSWEFLQLSREKASEFLPVASLALPDDMGLPALAFQRRQRGFVASGVAADLGEPVVAIACRHPGPARTVVAMPETAVNEDDGLAGGEGEVGFSRQVRAAKTETEAEGVGGAANGELGRRVGRLHCSHDSGAFERREDVGHQDLARYKRDLV